ncbi:MAG: hypothetical protein LHV69_11275 [Elusimicrobia bacterium]|nr:hypothetical protein [Candidatus Obscuribacterium magneticum]
MAIDQKNHFVRLAKGTVQSFAMGSPQQKPIPAPQFQSLVRNSGLENAEQALLNQDIGKQAFFCAPDHSRKNSSVENKNGLLCRFRPKETCSDNILDRDIQRVEDRLDRRPRRCLYSKTSAEVRAFFLGAFQC